MYRYIEGHGVISNSYTVKCYLLKINKVYNYNLLDKDAEKEEENEEQLMVELLDQKGHSDFTANILFYIAGYIVSKLVKLLTCPDCITSLTSQPSTNPDQDCVVFGTTVLQLHLPLHCL